MRRTRLLSILTVLIGQGNFAVQADPRVDFHDNGDPGQSTQDGTPTPIAPISAARATTVYGHLFERFRRPGQTPATQHPASVATTPMRELGQD